MNFRLSLALSLWIIIILLLLFGLTFTTKQAYILRDQDPQPNPSSSLNDFRVNEKSSKVSAVSADEDILASLGTDHKYSPAMAVDTEGNLWTVYSYHNTTYYLLDILKSTNGGEDWVRKIFIYSVNFLGNPDIAVDLYDNNVYVVYEAAELGNTSSHDIEIFRYNQWNIIGVDTDTLDQRNPSIAIDPNYGSNNYIYVAYEQLTNHNNREMIVRKSTDHGSSWGDGWHYRGFSNTDVHTQMDIATDFLGQVYLTYAWGNNSDELRRIVVEYGSRDSIDILFENGGYVYLTQLNTLSHPVIAVSRSSSITTRVVVAFEYELSTTDHDIMVMSSIDGGTTWNSSYVALSDEREGRPNVVADGMDVNSSSDTDGRFYLVYAKRFQGVNDSFIILASSYSSPTKWREFHTYGGLKNIWNKTKRVFGMTTYSNDSSNLVVSYAATSCYSCTDTQIYSTIFSSDLSSLFTFTSPNDTTRWKAGTIEPITWSYTGTINYVNIFLYKGSSPLGWIAQGAENLGYYDWGIPDFLDPGIDYWMDIEDANNTAIYAFSSLFEIITDNPKIYFTNPTPVSAWRAGATYIITWNCKNPLGEVTLEILKDGDVEDVLSDDTDGESHFKWEIPYDISEGDDYQLKISLNSNPNIYGISEEFKIIIPLFKKEKTMETAETQFLPTPGFDFTILIFGIIIIISCKRKKSRILEVR